MGRPKGVPNKASLTMRGALRRIGFDAAVEWVNAIMEIKDPVLRAQQLEKLMPYIHPKIREIEMTPSQILELEDEEIRALKPAELSDAELLASLGEKDEHNS